MSIRDNTYLPNKQQTVESASGHTRSLSKKGSVYKSETISACNIIPFHLTLSPSDPNCSGAIAVYLNPDPRF